MALPDPFLVRPVLTLAKTYKLPASEILGCKSDLLQVTGSARSVPGVSPRHAGNLCPCKDPFREPERG